MQFKVAQDEQELYKDSLICYYTRDSFLKKDLGVGLQVTRNSRNGFPSHCVPAFDLISLKTFVKHGIRRSTNNEAFTYWLPLYLNMETKEKTVY